MTKPCVHRRMAVVPRRGCSQQRGSCHPSPPGPAQTPEALHCRDSTGALKQQRRGSQDPLSAFRDTWGTSGWGAADGTRGRKDQGPSPFWRERGPGNKSEHRLVVNLPSGEVCKCGDALGAL